MRTWSVLRLRLMKAAVLSQLSWSLACSNVPLPLLTVENQSCRVTKSNLRSVSVSDARLLVTVAQMLSAAPDDTVDAEIFDH